ncbi:biotin/lipoyl-containing protein [Hymenobacter aerophilus]|uniref:biotin/lipoyl-containing protein n=1 Tax=Hymenobacter aerophilus TaxID=119644 RepID=UPI00037DA6BC|nr:biotin/lipoyl-containing protein [Hymenobacter aerophilus]
MLQIQLAAAAQSPLEVDYQPNGAVTVGGQPFAWDLTALGNGRYSILYQNRSYNAELLEIDYAAKTVALKINDQRLEFQAKDRLDLLLDKMGLSAAVSTKVNELKAPMPGLIVDVRVEPGQTVQKGDALLVLEAMKMENILKAPGEGIVAAIKVSLRDNVTKGQVLIQFA